MIHKNPETDIGFILKFRKSKSQTVALTSISAWNSIPASRNTQKETEPETYLLLSYILSSAGIKDMDHYYPVSIANLFG